MARPPSPLHGRAPAASVQRAAQPSEPASATAEQTWRRLRMELVMLRNAMHKRAGERGPQLFFAFSVAAALLLAGRFVLQPRLRAWGARRWPGTELGLSLPGLLALLAQTGLALLSGVLIVLALEPGRSARLTGIGQLWLAVLTLGSFVMALGRAYLPLVDAAAGRPGASRGLRSVNAWIAVLLLALTVSERIAMRVDAGPLLWQWVQWSGAGLFVLCFGAALVQAAAVLRRAPDTMGVGGRLTFQLLRIAILLGWLSIGVCIAATLLDRSAFALFLAKQVLWSLLVLLFARLVWRVVRDATDVLLARQTVVRGWARRLGVQPRRVQQGIVIASGVAQLALGLIALLLLAVPYGLGPDDLFGRVLGQRGELHFGELVISPAQLLRAVLVLLAALLAVRLATGWLAQRLLPTTRWDRGMQSSLATLAGYVGVVIAVSMALAALGIGLDRIAWIASALTVGIGFGLQAIVQNFISGLILLAERPVKVGDWVVVGDAEGDVRRIHVRATEIAMADRTTVLVPNSELITKVVRNRTYAASDGLVKVMLPLAISADVARAVGIIEDVVRQQPELLVEPPPVVQVEEVKDARIWVGVSAYVQGPRLAARARGALLYALLQRLQSEGIALA